MGIKLSFDYLGHPENPTFILTTRAGKNICLLPAKEIHASDSMTGSELSMKVYREDCGSNWNAIRDFRLIYCPEYNQFYELSLDLEESSEIVKIISAVSLGEAELAQILLHEIEINTETDIARDDYKVTVLYDPDDPDASLLDRIMEKAPHYSIAHVDATITNIQRTFTFDGTTLYDAFQEIGDEIGCHFVIRCGRDNDGKMTRYIYVYDLMTYCVDCGKRTDSIDSCSSCGGTNILPGYGKDTTIMISTENLSDDITYSTDTGSVKNCFRLEAGDDLMTATIVNCNPNGSAYVWYFSDEAREDMSDELRAALASYDALSDEYNNTRIYTLDSSLVAAYNALVAKYSDSARTVYNEDLSPISESITGYSSVLDAYYDAIDFGLYLSDAMMPTATMSDTSAAAQVALLTAANIGTVAVTDLNTCSLATASNAVLAMAKVIVDSRYQVKIAASSYNTGASSGTWSFTVSNYSDEEDTATGAAVTIDINEDYETYVRNKIDKAIYSKENSTGVTDISSLFKLTDSASAGTPFKTALTNYCLSSLNSYYDACQACLDVLVEQGVADGTSWEGIYDDVYTPYYIKLQSLTAEIAVREAEIATVQGTYDDSGGTLTVGMLTLLDEIRRSVTTALNFENYVGSDLWKELSSFRREDTYSNSNYISDGLNNAELIANAREFIETAQNEIFKSATMQHSITATLKNLLAMPEFAPIVDSFEVGNYIRILADGHLYKLRLLSFDIGYDNLDTLDVTFSDVLTDASAASEVRKQFQTLSNIAGSYAYTQKQAGQGERGNVQLQNWVQQGLDLTNMKIVSSASNQDITWDSHGLLARAYYDDTDTYSDSQVKLTNAGLYYTNDAWQTASAGVGKFYYYDPSDKETKEGYGVIADTIVGNIILGESVGIYNENGTISLSSSGIEIKKITAGREETVFKADTDGDLSLQGKIYAIGGTIGGLEINDNSIQSSNGRLIINGNGEITVKDSDTNRTQEAWLYNGGLIVHGYADMNDEILVTDIDGYGISMGIDNGTEISYTTRIRPNSLVVNGIDILNALTTYGNTITSLEGDVTDLETLVSSNIINRTSTMSLYGLASGVISNSKQRFLIRIPVRKNLSSDISACSLYSGLVIIRQGGNYLLGSSSGGQDLTDSTVIDAVSCSIDSMGIVMQIDVLSPVSVAINNDPVSCWFTSGILTFS